MGASFLFCEIEIPNCYAEEFNVAVTEAAARINRDLDRPDYDVTELRDRLEINGVGDYSDVDAYSNEEVKDVVRGAVKELTEAFIGQYGSIGYRTDRGRSYAITGGMSNGDEPSDYSEFMRIVDCAGHSFVDSADRCSLDKTCSRRESFLGGDSHNRNGCHLCGAPSTEAVVGTWTFCPFCGEHLAGMKRIVEETNDDPESQF